MSADQVRDAAAKIRANVQQVVVGKGEAVDLALVALLCHGHILIEDVPGIGKTTLAKALAWSIDCQFRRIQFTPDLMPADILGVNVYNMKSGQFEFRAGPVFTQVLLADELNRATPRTQSALLEAMQERQATMDGVTRPLPEPFLVLATLNPIEMEGTFPLPEGQLDRFMMRIRLGYPSHVEESEILARFQHVTTAIPKINSVLTAAELVKLQSLVTDVMIDDTLRDYLLHIVEETRKSNELELGASPRASLALYKATQAWAAVNGRSYVLPDDIKRLAEPVLAHRLIPNSQARLRGRRPAQILDDIVRGVPVPIQRRS
ncbi:MAG: MoxR family ATPase [Chloroflexi bacterium]|nr:MoxR family ATPase [Chloroflexota bacterium]